MRYIFLGIRSGLLTGHVQGSPQADRESASSAQDHISDWHQCDKIGYKIVGKKKKFMIYQKKMD